MDRYICIHGHFYQPPRENPWLEAIEWQDSAYPYHDWNERITAECYAPNGASRILDEEGRIARIVNNYARISFNFGPTLLNWLETESPEAYRNILAADRESSQTFSGHGSALAQAYNHLILPLANSRDKRTQIIWGLRDFEHRFHRRPEGMWLPEAAVDLESLEIMAEQGIAFTILAPYQAHRLRREGAQSWQEVSDGSIDPSMAYALRLPSGRTINLFFYDGPLSQAVAFDGLLENGETFAERLLTGFSDQRSWPQLVHIATDGESYGHHHPHGDMALAYALHHLEERGLARITNYGQFLEQRPPTHEVEIFENTSWSCPHGIERWRSNCGCHSGGHGDWNQEWRAPLREALDWLRDTLAPPYEARASQLVADPWAARDAYISAVLDRSPENVEAFLAGQARRGLPEAERVTLLKLLEMQRHALLMYTSCGWFFDELSGIETVQVIQYAGRAIQLAQETLEVGDLETAFLERLGQARSNIPEQGDGSRIYEKYVQPATIDLARVAAHFAVSSLFETYPDRTRVFSYTVDREDYQNLQAGKARVMLGRARVTSEITREAGRFAFGVLYFGEHNLNAGVRRLRGEEAYRTLTSEIAEAFERADLPEALRLLDRHFEGTTYSLRSLFRDEQRKVLAPVLESVLAEAEVAYRQIYGHHASLLHLVDDLGLPLPSAFQAAAQLSLHADLRGALADENLDRERVVALLDEARRLRVTLDGVGLAHTLKQTLERMMAQLRSDPAGLPLLQRMGVAAKLVRTLPFPVDRWKVQNIYYEMMQTVAPNFRRQAVRGDEEKQVWLDHFTALGHELGIKVTEMDEMQTIPMVAAAALARAARVPVVTYRFQFNRDFSFRDAQALVPYLHDLGISDAYSSPILKGGCTHGYDVSDPSQINACLGSEEDLAAFTSGLRERGMGLILDVVPNHMGIRDQSNAWWMDVLENGPSSPYSSYFDIDWHPVKPELENRVLLPILEDQYGKVLESGKLQLAYEDGAFFIRYYDTILPVDPATYSIILSCQLIVLTQTLGEEHEYVQELQSILTALRHLPPQPEMETQKVAERHREKEVAKRRLSSLYQASAEVRGAVAAAVRHFNGVVGEARSFDWLDTLLSAQAYRPAFWRVAAEEINYRRFFDINELAALRVELPAVFQASHQLVLRLVAEGKVTGLRIDHPDGLRNPPSYFRQLQESYLLQRVKAEAAAAETPDDLLPDDLEELLAEWLDRQAQRSEDSTRVWPLYVVAEKILGEDEWLPQDWAVYGTTGYEFLNAVNGLFVDSSNARAFDRLYSQFIGASFNYRDLVNYTKKMIMTESMASEINALGHQLERMAEKNRRYRDFTLNSLTFAVREIIACLPVYRTYITGPGGMVTGHDRRYLEAAVAEARRRNPGTAEPIFDFVSDTLLLRNAGDFPEEDQPRLADFVMKFQQVSAPVMAKGVEDTAIYIYNRLVSLNEVGGSPERFGLPVEDFHRANAARQRRWPHSLLATSTHDTKRSEDVRARIHVLSEVPAEWKAALVRWSRWNASKKTPVDGDLAPDRNDEYLFYQTLLGAWPLPAAGGEEVSTEAMSDLAERMVEYMLKATKEAKVHTSWVNPNEEYDAAVRSFVLGVLEDTARNRFWPDFRDFQRWVSYFGQFNSLSQVLLKLTSPGVPDLYQGNEIWDFSLVDPDNRRPVDYERRTAMLAELQDRVRGGGCCLTRLARELLASSQDGRIKMYLTWRGLSFRRDHPQLFADGCYLPLPASGTRQEHVCAFARVMGEEAALVVAPRLVARLTGGEERPPLGGLAWQDTWLALPHERVGQSYRNLLTGEVLAVEEQDGTPGLALAALLQHFPVALLERVAGPTSEE